MSGHHPAWVMIARLNVVAPVAGNRDRGGRRDAGHPGGFIPLALKEISELDRSGAEYAVAWLASRSCRCCRSWPRSSIAEGARLPERTPADHLASRRGRLGD